MHQLGFVVRDLEQSIARYEPIFGRFDKRMEHAFDNMIYRGKRISGRMGLAFAYSGDIEIELIQVLEGRTFHSEFLETQGEGLHHVSFQVDDMAAMIAAAARIGYSPVCGQHIEGVAEYHYLEHSDDRGAIYLEFLQLFEDSDGG